MRGGRLLLLLLWCAGWHAGAEELPRPIRFVIDGHRIPANAYALYVREAGRQSPLLSVNPGLPLNPASAIKIVPTLAALEALGPSYRWKTEVYLLGTLNKGVLRGDLLFKGYGDPYLLTEEFRKLLQELRRRGLREITGDVLIDNSYFKVFPADFAIIDDKPYRTYNVPPDAFLVNFKAVYFHFYPARDGRRVLVYPEPELAGLKIDNRLRLRRRYCGGFQRGVAVAMPNERALDHVIFSGRFPTGCERYTMARTVLTHKTYAFGLFKSLWEQLGGVVHGRARAGAAPPAQEPFLAWRSRPLSDVIKLINKFSNNVMSRQLLLTLGAELRDQPGTTTKGIDAVGEYLAEVGLDADVMTMENGSGLSRTARASALFLAELLDYAWTIPYRPEFIASLPIAGIDGTAKKRLRRKAAEGYSHVKTGTLDHVSTVAGYVHAASGRHYVVAGLLNHPGAHKGPGKELMDALIAWTHTQ